VEVERLSANIPDFENPSSGVSEMAEDAAREADGREQEREYEQFQAEQARSGRPMERPSLRERLRSRLHRWADFEP
jgi:hypothetical protein